ncbi:MAG TPA: hypothetical protein VJ727_03050 [Rhodanobacteraceae bacterium]|nr:hypothetical protein [Rhodanobacteraceae bacterium]
MNISPDNIELELTRRARALHEHACEHVDARTRAKLAAARRSALAAKDHRPQRAIWLPAVGAVAACALVLGVVWFRPQPETPVAPQQQASTTSDAELPLDTDAQQLDLYQNLDFYQWLARQPQTRAPSNRSRQ